MIFTFFQFTTFVLKLSYVIKHRHQLRRRFLFVSIKFSDMLLFMRSAHYYTLA